MENIEQYVENLDIEELKEIAREKYKTKHRQIKKILIFIDNTVNYFGKNSPINNSAHSESYETIKEELNKKGIWDERYDFCYEQALEGKLNKEELDKIE